MLIEALPERFRRKIIIDLTKGCWLWQGRRRKGYGRLEFCYIVFSAHRFIFELLVGPVPDGFELHHKCGVRPCCNPDHLKVVTDREHGFLSRNSHCLHGHELTDENSFYHPSDGKRRCLTCRRESSRRATHRYRSKQKRKLLCQSNTVS